MFRRSLLGLVISVALVLSLMATTATATTAGRTAESSPDSEIGGGYGDHELIEALITYELLDDWLASSPVSPQASLLEVSGSASYQANRREFLDSLEVWGERHRQFRTDLARVDTAQDSVETLRTVTMQIRGALALDDRLAEVSSTAAAISQAADLLAQVEGHSHKLGFSMDAVTLAERHLEDVRALVEAEVSGLTSDDVEISTKSGASTIARLTALQDELDNVEDLIARGSAQVEPARAENNRLQASSVARMPQLHAARTLATTEIGGLPLVTVDAYLRAASNLDSSCPVDWTLLAGIGHIESRHGTLGGASVQASGHVTDDILGPLLDGGATEREADEARELAQEEARLEGEAIADAQAEAARVAEEEAYEASVWGQLRREALAAQGAAESDGKDTSSASTKDPNSDGRSSATQPAGETNDEDVPPGPSYETHDPALWGNFLSYAPEDAPTTTEAETGDSDDTEDSEADEEVPEFKGNGFAVIRDSDDGRLDGNSRWDRAVGPMQFIPETWSYWETDGNRDGVADPQNLYDAAASAGRFLCHLSRTRGASPWTFVLGYNSSDTYVRNVMSSAEAFRGSALPDVQALLAS